MTQKISHNDNGVQVVECFACRKETLYARAGKYKGYLYCDPCYLGKLDEAINNWKNDYRRERNGKESFGTSDVLKAPRLSEYIN